jgi:hypothetical protein
MHTHARKVHAMNQHAVHAETSDAHALPIHAMHAHAEGPMPCIAELIAKCQLLP